MPARECNNRAGKKVVNFIFIAIEHLQLRLQCCIVATIGIASKARVKIEGIAFFSICRSTKKAALENMSTQKWHIHVAL